MVVSSWWSGSSTLHYTRTLSLDAYNVTTAQSLSGLAYWLHLKELLLFAPWHASISGVNSPSSTFLPLSASPLSLFTAVKGPGFTVSKPSALSYRQLELWASHYPPLLLCFYLTECSSLLHNEQRWNHRKGEKYHIKHTQVLWTTQTSPSFTNCVLSPREMWQFLIKNVRNREGNFFFFFCNSNNELVTTLPSCNLQIRTFQNFNEETLICEEKTTRIYN